MNTLQIKSFQIFSRIPEWKLTNTYLNNLYFYTAHVEVLKSKWGRVKLMVKNKLKEETKFLDINMYINLI
jgi:hypothetical protein